MPACWCLGRLAVIQPRAVGPVTQSLRDPGEERMRWAVWLSGSCQGHWASRWAESEPALAIPPGPKPKEQLAMAELAC